MAGLLDLVGNDQALLGLGLLSAAGPSDRRVSVGQGLFGAMQNVQQARQAREAQELKRKMAEAQIGEIEAQRAQREAAATDMQRKAEAQAAQQQMLSGAVAGGNVNFQQLIAAGVPIETVKALAESRNYGRDEVARTVETVENGAPVTAQFTKYGERVGAGAPKWVAPDKVDTGGKVQFFDPVTLKPLNSLAKTSTPDALLSAQTAMRGQNMTDARAREANATTAQNGKIPPGYRMKLDGTLEAIPGGPADIKAGELGAKAEAKKASTIAQANSVLDTINDAKKLVGVTTAGVGGYAASLPATDARNLAGKLETIKANLGFDRLQQMRDQSPTGGALGAVAVQELTALQSTIASLDQKQSPAELKAALNKIEGHYSRWLRTVGGPREGGASGSWEAPNAGGVKFLGFE